MGVIFKSPFSTCLSLGLLLWLAGTLVGAETNPFSEFDAWWKQYTDVAAAERPALVDKGMELAKARHEAMVALIEKDPRSAIEKAFAEEFHTALPVPIRPLVEKHVRGLAKLVVTKGKDGAVQRKVTIDAVTWKAFLYGARLELNSREEIPIHGVALSGRVAVNGSPLERFPDRETLLTVLAKGEGKKSCPICGEPGEIPAAVGDVLLWFDGEEHLVVTENALIEKEASPEDAAAE